MKFKEEWFSVMKKLKFTYVRIPLFHNSVIRFTSFTPLYIDSARLNRNTPLSIPQPTYVQGALTTQEYS